MVLYYFDVKTRMTSSLTVQDTIEMIKTIRSPFLLRMNHTGQLVFTCMKKKSIISGYTTREQQCERKRSQQVVDPHLTASKTTQFCFDILSGNFFFNVQNKFHNSVFV